MPRNYQPHQYDHRVVRRQTEHDDDVLQQAEAGQAADPSRLIALQRHVGNTGVRSMLRTGAIHQVAGADMVHRKGCGCASCTGGQDRISRVVAPQIQRFWGDDEEDSGDSGGSVWDSVTDAASSAWDTASGAVSDAASSVSDTASEVGGAVSDAASSAWNAAGEVASEVGGAVSDAAGAVSDAAGSAWGAVTGAAESAWGAVTGAAEDVGNAFGGLFGDEESGEKEDEEDNPLPTSGSVDAIKGSPLAIGSGCDLPYGTPHPRFFRPSPRLQAAQRKPTQPTRPFRVNANITMVEHSGEKAPVETSSFAAFDMPTNFSVGSNLDFGSQTEAGGVAIPGEAFGYAKPTITVDNIKWTLDPASATVNIYARVHIWVNWAVQSNDKKDINTGNEDFINAQNWDYIIQDIEPVHAEGKPARTMYYSSTATVKHELFHANEYIATGKGQLPSQATWLGTQSINLPEDKSSDYPSVIGKQVSSLMSTVRDNVEKGLRDKYNGGGEQRAYSDGKGEYTTIISTIEKRAKSSGWPKNLINR